MGDRGDFGNQTAVWKIPRIWWPIDLWVHSSLAHRLLYSEYLIWLIICFLCFPRILHRHLSLFFHFYFQKGATSSHYNHKFNWVALHCKRKDSRFVHEKRLFGLVCLERNYGMNVYVYIRSHPYIFVFNFRNHFINKRNNNSCSHYFLRLFQLF